MECLFSTIKIRCFCYLWYHKKHKCPYIGIIEGTHFDEPFLLKENRSKIKIMLLKLNEDLPLSKIESVLQKGINLYKTGVIKIKK